ncbi:MAG: DUF1489 domain-containing protein [Pelagimonas sp.]|nr:DUF1489 domain-containing protein [Pelagimonas sp.]
MDKHVHLIKLSVGTETVEDLEAWQYSLAQRFADGLPRHVTRMFPKRDAEILNGGSIYWVFKGQVQCRQRILRLDRVEGQDGKPHCAIVLKPGLIRTVGAPRRPFQGWRYLAPEDAPADLPSNRQTEDQLPPELAGALADIGVI